MPSSSAFSVQQNPTRSISLPTRLQHPTATKFEAKLNRQKTFEIPTATHLSAESLETILVELAELYSCVQEPLQSTTTRNRFQQHQNKAIVEEALEESIELLDCCTNIHDLYLKINESVRNLQSATRRKSGGYSRIQADISSYLLFRKTAQKDVAKSLRTLKHAEKKLALPLLFDLDQHLSMVVQLIRELTIKTISVFRSSLLFLSWPCSKTKWSMISKLMLKKSGSEKGDSRLNDAGSVDIVVLSSLHMQNSHNVDVKAVNTTLKMFEDSITKVEVAVQCMFRQLLQYRVSLLNVLIQ